MQPSAESESSTGSAVQEESVETTQAPSQEVPAEEHVIKSDGVELQDPQGNLLEAGAEQPGEAPAQSALQRLLEAGHPAQLMAEADAPSGLPAGYAYIALEGGLGIWNTGDGYIYLYDPQLSADALLAAFQAAVNP